VRADPIFPMFEQSLAELGDALAGIDAAQVHASVAAIAGARRIAVYGVGREGLQIKGLAMRLYHLGLDAHVVGDMNCPPLGAGDLLICSAGPGSFSTVAALLGVARHDGARTLLVTAQQQAACAALADTVLVVPAQTMANDQAPSTSILPMGSLYEGALYLLFETLVLLLRRHLNIDPGAMRMRHTNLE
jgi:6-phospho-3-hexuloisomerase